MSFIRLSKVLINSKYINNIRHIENKYVIFITTHTNNIKYVVCKKENTEDHKVITAWVNCQYGHNRWDYRIPICGHTELSPK
jgi:hypothetical protein